MHRRTKEPLGFHRETPGSRDRPRFCDGTLKSRATYRAMRIDGVTWKMTNDMWPKRTCRRPRKLIVSGRVGNPEIAKNGSAPPHAFSPGFSGFCHREPLKSTKNRTFSRFRDFSQGELRASGIRFGGRPVGVYTGASRCMRSLQSETEKYFGPLPAGVGSGGPILAKTGVSCLPEPGAVSANALTSEMPRHSLFRVGRSQRWANNPSRSPRPRSFDGIESTTAPGFWRERSDGILPGQLGWPLIAGSPNTCQGGCRSQPRRGCARLARHLAGSSAGNSRRPAGLRTARSADGRGSSAGASRFHLVRSDGPGNWGRREDSGSMTLASSGLPPRLRQTVRNRP